MSYGLLLLAWISLWSVITESLWDNRDGASGCAHGSTEYTTVSDLGAGTYSNVVKVTRNSDKHQFAMKVPKQGLEFALEYELDVMMYLQDALSGTDCLATLVLAVDDNVSCLDGETLEHSLVLPLMLGGDLEGWLPHVDDATQGNTFDMCSDMIGNELVKGLECIHKADVMHGDIKLANIMFETRDKQGCPQGLRFADFGLVRALGADEDKFTTGYQTSFYLYGAMFKDAPSDFDDALGLSINATHYKVADELDFCSMFFLQQGLRSQATYATPSGKDWRMPGNFSREQCGQHMFRGLQGRRAQTPPSSPIASDLERLGQAFRKVKKETLMKHLTNVPGRF